MKNVIDQIAKIDAVAFENEQKNRTILNHQKRIFENEIKRYRIHKLKEANKAANEVYNSIMDKARTDYQQLEAEMKRKTEQLENRYYKVNEDVIDKIFSKIFTVQ